jgi:hypothetical protein
MKLRITLQPTVALSCCGYLDRRTEAQHASYAAIEEQRFQYRVARNAKERDRIQREVAREFAIPRRQAG